MNFKIALAVTVSIFCLFCGVLVFKTGLFENGSSQSGCILLQNSSDVSRDANAPKMQLAPENTKQTVFTAENAETKIITAGSIDPNSGFEFALELNSRGGSVPTATFSKFNDRDSKKPLKILSPFDDTYSLSNSNFVFVKEESQLPLGKLNWTGGDIESSQDGAQIIRWQAELKTSEGKPAARLTKTYKVYPGRYDFDINLTAENLGATQQKMRFNLSGPVGMAKEDPQDEVKIIGGFTGKEGIVSTSLDLKQLQNAKTEDQRKIIKPGANFLWAALTNKYFAAILVPVPEQGKEICDWIGEATGTVYSNQAGTQTIGFEYKIAPDTFAPAGQDGSSKTYNFRVYLGPKDKRIFDKNDYYRTMGFVHTISFMPCFCCPASVIYPLAFGILASMEWMYKFIPNYGIVIIILVFFIRLVLHPLTKKSQVSMSKMAKLGPKVEEIKKQYGDNKAEMNKRVMTLYKEQGASPILGMIPMFVQMPIWIALYSAIYASIALRGAAFLPFWITDLSAPDALIKFPAFTLPILGTLDAVNFLPILMGVAFYLQQKLTPTQASADPHVAQQQKMMLIMMPILFPIMLYKAPSGLNLYIMASTFAGVIEQYVIKKHIQEHEQEQEKGLVDVTSKTGGKVKKKKPKPFFRF